MNSFFVGLIVILTMFAFCILAAYIINIIKYGRIKEKAPPQNNGSAQIYYVTDYKNKPQKKKNKKLDIALKQTIISRDNFKRLYFDDN